MPTKKPSSLAKVGGRKKGNHNRPIDKLIDKYGAGQNTDEEEADLQQPKEENTKLKFPLLLQLMWYRRRPIQIH